MPSKLFTLARIFIWFYGISTEDKVTKQITLFNINTPGVALHENYIVAGCLVADGHYYSRDEHRMWAKYELTKDAVVYYGIRALNIQAFRPETVSWLEMYVCCWDPAEDKDPLKYVSYCAIENPWCSTCWRMRSGRFLKRFQSEFEKCLQFASYTNILRKTFYWADASSIEEMVDLHTIQLYTQCAYHIIINSRKNRFANVNSALDNYCFRLKG